MADFLETERVFIRAPKASDFDNWLSVSPESPEKVQKFLDRCIVEFESNGFSMGSVMSKDTGEFIGRAGLYYYFAEDSTYDIELGCFVAREHQNKGYGKELTKAMINWGMQNLNIERLTALTPADLSNSHLVLENSGMQRVEPLTIDGEHLWLYEITRANFNGLRDAVDTAGEFKFAAKKVLKCG